jgi:predicted  nucleic acid-binding Zn-ribbon protein
MARSCTNCGSAFADDEQVVVCPACGSRDVSITAEASAGVVAVAEAPGLELGYGPRGWQHQWDLFTRYLDRLRDVYASPPRDNQEVSDRVDLLLLAAWHLKDWVCADSDNQGKITTGRVDRYANNHLHLNIARGYANTAKHMRLRPHPRGPRLTARIAKFNVPGNRVTIGYRYEDEPEDAEGMIDALELAEHVRDDWVELLTARGIMHK